MTVCLAGAGIMGSLGFWPLTVFLPIELHIAQRGIKRFSLQWTLMQCLSAFCFCISVGAMIGAIAGIYIVRPPCLEQ